MNLSQFSNNVAQNGDLVTGLLLVVAAVIPAIALCIFIFFKDRAEKEPVWLLLSLLGLGVVSCIPTVVVEIVIDWILNAIAAPFVTEINGVMYLDQSILSIYNFVSSFIGVALVEEFFKWLFLWILTAKSKHFNSLFDGIIYSVFVSLGFAGFENILYVTQNGFGNAITRAVLSVPAHMFFAVIMGLYYSMWHMNKLAKAREKAYKANGLIDANAKEFPTKRHLLLCILMPTLAHGFFDFCLFQGTLIYTLLFFGFVVFLYIFCFIKIFRISKMDMSDKRYVTYLLAKKYPHLADELAKATRFEYAIEQAQKESGANM